MPRRRTKRGAERTPLAGDHDVIVCGASFAGLAVARELAGTGRVLLLDRYEIGERQTSACAAPTVWLEALGLGDSVRQTFDKLVMHTPHSTVRFPLPYTFSTFDYPQLCGLLDDQNDAQFETAKVEGRGATNGGAIEVRTDRGSVSAPLVVDALGWRRILGPNGYQPPDAPLSRGLEVHPHGSSGELEIWIDRSLVPAGYGWSFPAARRGAGRRGVVRPPLPRQGTDGGPRRPAAPRRRPLPGQLDPPPPAPARRKAEVFFAGDSAGHCLPLTAEGIRTAFYFGIALGRELRQVLDGRATRETALRRYGAFSDAHEMEVPLDAARAARGAARAAANARADEPRDGDPRLHALVFRPLPRGSPRRASSRSRPPPVRRLEAALAA